MTKKKLIQRIAFIAGGIFLLSVLGLISHVPYRNIQDTKRAIQLNQHLEELHQKYQKYLSTVTEKIESVPVNPLIISELQSEINGLQEEVDIYLWMHDAAGKFVFGIPAHAFNRLNTAYDKYLDTIEENGYYLNRNDFLSKLINHHYEINFSSFQRSSSNTSFCIRRFGRMIDWRYFNPKSAGYWYAKPTCFVLTSPVKNEQKELIGELYLNIDDPQNESLYYNRRGAGENDIYHYFFFPLFGFLTFFSGLILCFLLPTWVYIDAQQRDVKNPIIWALLTLFSLVFGLIIYLIIRPSKLKLLQCPDCARELNGVKGFCPYCGLDLSHTLCSQCQYPIQSDWSYCPSCRAELQLEQPIFAAVVKDEAVTENAKETDNLNELNESDETNKPAKG